MRNQSSRRWQTLLLVTIAIILLLGTFDSARAQNGVGAKYGARDPRDCDDKTAPKSGAMTATLAAKYVTCSAEKESTYLYLAEDVKVAQIAAARRYNPNEDINVPNIDVRASVYAIRGSYTGYQCSQIRPDKTNTKRNCTRYEYPQAHGLCYKDTFGDWHCSLVDATSDISERDVAPPGGATAESIAAAPRKTPQNDQNANDNAKQQPAVAITERDENGFPKLDFSALEKWFEVVRYEYAPTERKLYMYLKPKTDERETQFYVEFRDKDGILLQSRQEGEFPDIPSKYNAQTGDTVKAHTAIPRGEVLKQAVSAKIVKRL